MARGLAADPNRVPWGNMYEFTIAGTFVVGAGLPRRHEELAAPTGSARWSPRSCVAALMAAFLGLDDAVLPLPDALNSPWLVIHVVSAVISTGAFTIGALLSGLYLLKSRSTRETGYLARVPDLKVLDRLSYRMHAFGFPVWTFAVLITGPIWAHQAWGAYWNWDPKEVWAFITWVVYAAYLHARATAGLARAQRRAAGAGRCRDAVVQLHRHQLLQLLQPALVRRGRRAGDVSRRPGRGVAGRARAGSRGRRRGRSRAGVTSYPRRGAAASA